MSENLTDPWECAVCDEPFTGEPTEISKAGAPVCKQCVVEGKRLNERIQARMKKRGKKKRKR